MPTNTQPLHSQLDQRLIIAMVLLILGAAIALNLYQEWGRTLKREQDKLITQARVIQMNVAHNLLSVNTALAVLGKDLSTLKADSELNQRLQVLSDAMPAMRTLLVVDAEGVIRASSRAEVIGKDVSQRAYFQEPKRRQLADMLYVSPPFRSVLGTFTINVSHTIMGVDGKFAGVISAALDPAYFGSLVESVRYTPDMWVAIAHNAGEVFMVAPEKDAVLGKNLAQPNTFFSQHQLSGEITTVHQGTAFITGEKSLLVWSTVVHSSLKMDHPILVAVARDYDEIFANWRHDAGIQTTLYSMLVLSFAIGLYAYGRRQREFERQAEASDQSLRESNEKLRQLYELSPVGILLSDSKGRVIEFNAAFAKICGYSDDELHALKVKDLTPAGYKVEERAQVNCLLSTGRYGPYEKELIRKDGRLIPVRLNGVLVGECNARKTWSIVEDITDTKRLKDGLREKMQELDMILDNSSVGIAFLKARQLLWLNKRMLEMFGYTQEELVNQTTAIFYASSEAYEDFGRRAYVEIVAGRRFATELQMRHRNGSLIWMRISGQSTPDDYSAGDSIWVLEEITERKRQEAELEEHRANLEGLVQERTKALIQTETRASHILNSSADGLYGTDGNGLITFINPAACAMLGYMPEQIIGREAHAIFHHTHSDGTPYPAMSCPGLVALQQGETVRVENEVFWHANGHALPVMYSAHPMRHEGKIIGAVTSFVDVSEQRAATEAREQALIAAETLARMRSEFLSNVSHELRTPLNGILGFASIGYRQYNDAEKARNAFAKIKESGERLFEVVKDVLDFSNIDAGKLTIKQTKISLPEVVDRAIEVIRDRALAKHLDLRVDLSPTLPSHCLGDPLRIQQVLLKLLSNAVKFTEAGHVALSIELLEEQLLFRVADTGIGIASEKLEGLFNPFHQVDGSSNRKFGGTGLGLAISQRLVELMGGDIRIESQPSIGTIVEFRLPYLKASSEICYLSPTLIEHG